MIAEVRVVSQSEFDAWLTGEVAKLSDPVAIGQNVFENNCKDCHTIDGSKGVGPSWLGLYGREETLTDGTTVVVDEAYIIESIINTNAKIVAGYPAGVMPQNYGEVLTEADQWRDRVHQDVGAVAAVPESGEALMDEQKKGGFFSIGLVKGISGYVVSMVVGLALVTVLRMILRLPATTPWDPQAKTFFFVEGAWVAGALLGTIFFVLSVVL